MNAGSEFTDFIAEMEQEYGRRDPQCDHCGSHVWMALQGFYGGGTWTTNAIEEGPLGTGAGPGVVCAASPDGHHEVTKKEGRR